jgi:hypothetical protein
MAEPTRHFIMAGMPRAGTTFVYDTLLSHPSIHLPYRKEISFYSLHYDRGSDWYNAFFAGATAQQVTGDISPDYFLHPDAVSRIRNSKRAAKLILAVRDPAEWAVSFHRYIGTFGQNSLSFERFLESHEVPNARWLESTDPRARFSIRNALIRLQIEAFRETFGADLLLYHFALFQANPLAVMQAIESFLGIPSYFNHANIPTVAINTRQKRGASWLNKLTSRDEIITLAGKIFPRRFLQRVRYWSDTTAARGRAASQDAETKHDLSLGKSLLQGDEQYVAELFAHGPVLLGDGKTLHS